MIIDQLFTQPIFEAADPSKLIVSVRIEPMSTGGEPIDKEVDLTGQFQGSMGSQMNQALDYMKKMLESKGFYFTTLRVSYQGKSLGMQNRGAMSPQSDEEREMDSMADQIRAKRSKQNALPAVKEDAASPEQLAYNKLRAQWDGYQAMTSGGENTAVSRDPAHAAKLATVPAEIARMAAALKAKGIDAEAQYDALSGPAAAPVDANQAYSESGLQKFSHKKNRFRSLHKLQNPLGEIAPPGAKAERMVKHIKQGYARDGKLTPKEKGIAFATAWKAHNAGRVEEGEITKNATGLKHRATDKYGAGDDEPHHYTGGRSGFSEPGKYARDLEHVNKQLVKDLDASMGISWKNRGTKGIEVDEQGVAETVSMDQAKKVLRHYGADHFKTTTNELHFYKNGRPMSVDLIFNDDATRSVNLSQLNSATRRLKGQGVVEGYTGRETKAGTWRVFKDGNAVAAAGPFKSADEAAAWIKKHKQGITEMDKSEPSAGRDGGPREGPEKIAKPITKEKMVKHALDALSKSMAKKDDKKKDVKESDTLMLKLRRALIKEGRVKELADDLKTMNDADFMKKYGKAKAAIRKDMKQVDEAEGQTVYTAQEIIDVLTGKKTQQQVDAERAKKSQPLKEIDAPAMPAAPRAPAAPEEPKVPAKPASSGYVNMGLKQQPMPAPGSTVAWDAPLHVNPSVSMGAPLPSGDPIENVKAGVQDAKEFYDLARKAGMPIGDAIPLAYKAGVATATGDIGGMVQAVTAHSNKNLDKGIQQLKSAIKDYADIYAQMLPTSEYYKKNIALNPQLKAQADEFIKTNMTPQQFAQSINQAETTLKTPSTMPTQASPTVQVREQAAMPPDQAARLAPYLQKGADGSQYYNLPTTNPGETGAAMGQTNISPAALAQIKSPQGQQKIIQQLLAMTEPKNAVPQSTTTATDVSDQYAGGLNELSTNQLARYKTAAAKDAKAADQAGDFKRGDKRLSGMVQATKKQFDNDAKKVDESRAARRALMARIVNSR